MINETNYLNLLSTLRERFNRQSAFTLVELLVVILIIGILLAIALPTFLNQQNKAYDTSTKVQLNTAYQVAKSSAATNTNNPGYFPSADQLIADITSSEPELTVIQTPLASASDIASDSTGDLGVVASSGGSAFCAVETSQSGTTFVLTVSGLGAPQTSSFADAANANCSGTGDIAGGGGSPTFSASTDHFWLSNASGDVSFYANGTQVASGLAASSSLFRESGNIYAVDSSGDLLQVNVNTGSTSVATPASALCGGAGIGQPAPASSLRAQPDGYATGIGGGRMAIVCNGVSGGSKIVAVNLDGSSPSTLVAETSSQTIGEISASSTELAYITTNNGGNAWVVPISGGAATLVRSGYCNAVAVAPNGTVYFAQNYLGRIGSASSSGSWLGVVFSYSSSISQIWQLRVSSDGSALAYVQNDSDTQLNSVKTFNLSNSAIGTTWSGDASSGQRTVGFVW